jgi:pimeloyl-ACP methyl ester carboxylesterase
VRSATFRPLPVGVEKMLCAPWVEGGMQGPMRFLREMVQAHYRETGVLEEGYGGVGRRSPTKIVWGNDDAWIPVEMAERLKKALNAEEMVVIAEAGHLVQYDQPGRLALEVGLWLSKHSEDEV